MGRPLLMSTRAAILQALQRGPMTNRQLQRATDNYWSGAIARDCAKLRHSGRIERLDGRSGRGKPAVYGLVQ